MTFEAATGGAFTPAGSTPQSQSLENVKADAVDGAPQTPTPEQKHRIKIDDEEFDLETLEKEFKRYKGKYEGSEKKFQEAANMRKQVEGLLERAQKGDLSWLKGIVPAQQLRKWQEEELLSEIEWEQLPDHEKRRIQAERERDKYRSELETTKQERETEQLRLLEGQAYAEIESDITQAIKELGHDVKVTPEFMRRVAELMLNQIEASDDPQDFRRVPAKEARDKVLSNGKKFVPELLSLLPISEVLNLIPKKVREAIRNADVEDAVSQMPRRIREQTGQVEKPRKTKEVRMSIDDYFSKRLEKKLR